MTKIITVCGSSRFIDIVAVVGWFLEKEENAIVLSMHLLPRWYAGEVSDHLAEHQGVADAMDELHFAKIGMSDEIFVVDSEGYIGESTANEIKYADEVCGTPARYLSKDPIGKLVTEAIHVAARKQVHGESYDPLKLGVWFGAAKTDNMGNTDYMYCQMDRQVLGQKIVRVWCVNKEHHADFDTMSGRCISHPGYFIKLWSMNEFENYELAIAHIKDTLGES